LSSTKLQNSDKQPKHTTSQNFLVVNTETFVSTLIKLSQCSRCI